MALRLISTIVNNNTFVFGNNDEIVVLANGAISSTTLKPVAIAGLPAQNVDILVDGTVAGETGGISLEGTGNQVAVGTKGTVFGSLNAIRLVGTDAQLDNAGTISGSVFVDGNGSQFNNSGYAISGSVFVFGNEARINNTGVITCDGRVFVAGNLAYVHNSGTIVGGTDPADTLGAVNVNTGLGATGWLVNEGTITAYNWAFRGGAGTNYVVNHGSMEGNIDFGGGAVAERFVNTGNVFGSVSGLGSSGSVVNNDGHITVSLVMSSGGDTVTNGGYIYNIDFGAVASVAGAADRLINSGHVSDDVTGFNDGSFVRNTGRIDDLLQMSNASDTLVNSGIIGRVFMGAGSGADRVNNSGTIDGVLTLSGSGAADITNSGNILGRLVTGNGSDIVRNSGTIRDVAMSDGNDIFRNNALGNVELTVGGGGGNDRLVGGDDVDRLSGDDGNDNLRGRAGDDLLQGGLGADRMEGGTGADQFIFAAATELVTAAPFDVITDFERGIDLINLQGMPGTLLFNGAGAFSGGGTGSVTYLVASGNATVRIDANGDGVSDGSIVVNNTTVLSAADFIL